MIVMRWAGIWVGVLGVSAFVTVARAEPLGARGPQADLPTGIAAFPIEASSVAQVRPASAPAPAAQPAQPPAAAPLVVPAAQPVPAKEAPPADPVPALPSAGAVSPDCPRSDSTFELGAAALAAMIRDGQGLFAVLGIFGDSSDERVIDDAAAREVRRLRLMHRLAAMREQESEREFSEKLTGYLRKRAFLEGLEAHRQLAPSPFGSHGR